MPGSWDYKMDSDAIEWASLIVRVSISLLTYYRQAVSVLDVSFYCFTSTASSNRVQSAGVSMSSFLFLVPGLPGPPFDIASFFLFSIKPRIGYSILSPHMLLPPFLDLSCLTRLLTSLWFLQAAEPLLAVPTLTSGSDERQALNRPIVAENHGRSLNHRWPSDRLTLLREAPSGRLALFI